jgi:hypothetical protein
MMGTVFYTPERLPSSFLNITSMKGLRNEGARRFWSELLEKIWKVKSEQRACAGFALDFNTTLMRLNDCLDEA